MDNPSDPRVAKPNNSAHPSQNCPVCGRKLLTQGSILCNWCGAKLEDPQFLEEAARVRHANDEAERARLAEAHKEEIRVHLLGQKRKPRKPSSLS